MVDEHVGQLLDHLFRRQSAQMVATLTRVIGTRDLALAEEAVQDALVTALQQWPFRGVPQEPAAWLFRVARNRALDRLRHQQIVEDKSSDVADTYHLSPSRQQVEATLANEVPSLEDDQLAMMFLTCHPALSREARVALTLKIVGGFSVGEIARAFLAHEAAIAQRLVRAKRMLRELDVPFESPAAADLDDRLDSVLEAIYLMFNEGYAATAGDVLVREDISAEAIRLTAMLTRHRVTARAQTWALLALLLFHTARFPGRTSKDGDVFQLRDQDRTTWDRTLIGKGLEAMARAAAGKEISAYHLEAEIAGCHAVAPTWQETDWARIVECYDRLVELTGSPLVQLNRAIACSQLAGPKVGIAELETLAATGVLDGYHLLPAALAELWREAGDAGRAAGYYRQALTIAMSAPERRFLSTRLDNL
jgi:RNA polymerase sigma-70 factor, ECF subfamily